MSFFLIRTSDSFPSNTDKGFSQLIILWVKKALLLQKCKKLTFLTQYFSRRWKLGLNEGKREERKKNSIKTIFICPKIFLYFWIEFVIFGSYLFCIHGLIQLGWILVEKKSPESQNLLFILGKNKIWK